jgi:hypothetical protein
MVGILVHGNNHFILSGPIPDEAAALALVRHWSIVQIGEAKSSSFGSGRSGRKSFARTWNGQSLSRATARPLQEWRNYLENFQLAG